MRKRTRCPNGEWGPWRTIADRPTKTPLCTVCHAPATFVEAKIVDGAFFRLNGRVERRPVIVSAPYYCDEHGGVS